MTGRKVELSAPEKGGELLGKACVRGIKVGAEPLADGCRGVQVGTQSLTEAEFAGGAA